MNRDNNNNDGDDGVVDGLATKQEDEEDEGMKGYPTEVEFQKNVEDREPPQHHPSSQSNNDSHSNHLHPPPPHHHTSGNGDDEGEIEADDDMRTARDEMPQQQRHDTHHNDTTTTSTSTDHHHHHHNGHAFDADNEASMALRPLFFGNLLLNYSTDQITNLFEHPERIDTLPQNDVYHPIPIDRIDIKRGYCFVFFKDATSLQEKQRIESFCMMINGM